MVTIRSFRSKILLALVAVALVPAGLSIAAGTLVLREVVAASGTAGPWQSVAESGRELLAAVEERAAGTPELEEAARRHREALSESVRLSRLYSVVSDRFLQILPLFAGLLVLVVAALSFAAARVLSRTFSAPIQELVGWTERLARGRPLPDPERVPPAGVREFEQLRSALRSMAHELDEARRRAVENARLRSWTDMARGVAHELKNPLTPMRMAARSVARIDDPRADEASEVLREEIERLDEMARSFSQLGHAPEGPTAEVDLEALLREVVEPFRRETVEIRVRADAEVPAVRGWYEALLRVFRNLVGNAFQAVDEGPSASDPRWIEVEIRHRDEDEVSVTIRDSGPGIPEHALDSIWDPDFTTRRKGTGLGLTLVRQAVEAHEGRVAAANAPEGGAEFEVILPVDGPGDEERPWTS